MIRKGGGSIEVGQVCRDTLWSGIKGHTLTVVDKVESEIVTNVRESAFTENAA